MERSARVAVVGATGLVGREVLAEDGEGLFRQLLFGFDDYAHKVCWKYFTRKSEGFKTASGPA